MTAFSRMQDQGSWGSLVCEIRSINHRYLEITTHLPDNLRVFEMPIRDIFRQKIKRGKIECIMRYKPDLSKTGSIFSINTELAGELCQASEKIGLFLQNAGPVSPLEILHYPGVLETQETDSKTLQPMVFQLLNQTLADLINARAREGEDLSRLFLHRMDLIQAELAKVKERLPQVLLEQKEKMHKRFADAKLELDSGRLEQEMVIFAQKMDVAEEADRIETHVAEVRRVLAEGGLAGRRLDFLLQELNREANTLGSKSSDSVLSLAVVEMKVLMEQVREQVQNIE